MRCDSIVAKSLFQKAPCLIVVSRRYVGVKPNCSEQRRELCQQNADNLRSSNQDLISMARVIPLTSQIETKVLRQQRRYDLSYHLYSSYMSDSILTYKSSIRRESYIVVMLYTRYRFSQ